MGRRKSVRVEVVLSEAEKNKSPKTITTATCRKIRSRWVDAMGRPSEALSISTSAFAELPARWPRGSVRGFGITSAACQCSDLKAPLPFFQSRLVWTIEGVSKRVVGSGFYTGLRGMFLTRGPICRLPQLRGDRRGVCGRGGWFCGSGLWEAQPQAKDPFSFRPKEAL